MYVKKKHTKETAEWDSYPEWDSLIRIFIDYSKNTQFSFKFHSIFRYFFAQFQLNSGVFLPNFFFRPFFTPIFLFSALVNLKIGWFERQRQFRLEQIRLEQPQKNHLCFLPNRWQWRACVDAWMTTAMSTCIDIFRFLQGCTSRRR